MASTMEDMVLARVHLIKELVCTTKRINRTSTRIHIIKEEGSSMVEVRVDITSSRRILDTIANRIEGNNMLLKGMDLRWLKEELEQREQRMTTKAVIRYPIRSATSRILGRS